MRGYDLKRTGANLVETAITPAKITAGSFGKLACYPVDGQVYAQILYVTAVDFGSGGKHDVVVVATMKNRVYVLDANDPSKVYWQQSYGTAIMKDEVVPDVNYKCQPYLDITRWIGILGTPTVDPATNTLYFVARTNQDGQHRQKLYAVNLADGSNRAGSPVEIAATYPGTGDPGEEPEEPDLLTDGHFSFNPKRHNQRAALTLTGGVVYIAWAAFCDWRPFHGWLIGYDAKTLAQTVVYNTTPNGYSGGIWMAGAGPAIDDDGTMYLATGNGSADLQGGPNRGESFLKLKRDSGSMKVLDWFTPYEYEFLEDDDRDLGAAGVLLVPGTNFLIGGGKQAKIYVADKNNLGKWTAPTTPYEKKQSGGKVGMPPDGSDNVLQTLEIASMSTPPNAHNHSTPVYWKSDAGEFIYTMAEEDNLRQWRIQNGRIDLYKASSVHAPDDQSEGGYPNSTGYTMPGGSMVLSANGMSSASGVLWVTLPISRDANEATVPGVMYAFDAKDVSQPLWSSQNNADRDSFGNFAKFNPVTVYNGRVYVPTFSDDDAANKFCVYGPLN